MAKWIEWTDDKKDYVKCPKCDYGAEGEMELKDKTNYCPQCGAPLEGQWPKSFSDTLEEVKAEMCDHYCKFPIMENENENWLFEEGGPCNECPLGKL